MKILMVVSACLTVLPLTSTGKCSPHERYSVRIHPAARIQFPGIVHGATDSQADGDVDCSSPAHWDGDTMYMFYSTGHPFRSAGSDLSSLSRPSQRVSFDNEAGWTMGGRWIESTYKAEDGRLNMWYHNEPPLSPDRTAPRPRDDSRALLSRAC